MAIDLGTIEAKLSIDDGGFTRTLKGAKSGLVGLGKGALAAAGAVAAVGAGVAAASTKLAGDFEASLVSAGAKAGATAGQLELMEKAALRASAESAFSAQDAADALGFLAQAGFSVQQQMEALPGALQLASAGELEVAESADIASNVLSGFGLEVKELARVNDVLVKSANTTNTSVRELAAAMSFAAPTAAGAGVALEETASAIGILSNAGIKATRAGTSFNAILAQMPKAAKDLGVELDGATIAEEGFANSLDKLIAGGLSAENAIELFGRRAGPGLQAILQQGTDAIRAQDKALQDAGGTAEEVAKKKIDTLNGAMNVLAGNVQNLGIKIGQQFLPVLQGAAEQSAVWTNSLVVADEEMAALRAGIIKATDMLGDMIIAGGHLGEILIKAGGAFTEAGRSISLLIDLAVQGADSLQMLARATMNVAIGDWEAADAIVRSFKERSRKRLRDIDRQFENLGSTWDAANEDGEQFRKGAERVAGALQSIAARAREANQVMSAGGGFFTGMDDLGAHIRETVGDLDGIIAEQNDKREKAEDDLQQKLSDKHKERLQRELELRQAMISEAADMEIDAMRAAHRERMSQLREEIEARKSQQIEKRTLEDEGIEMGAALVDPEDGMKIATDFGAQGILDQNEKDREKAKKTFDDTTAAVGALAGAVSELGGASNGVAQALGGLHNIMGQVAAFKAAEGIGAIAPGIGIGMGVVGMFSSLMGGGDDRRVASRRPEKSPEEIVRMMGDEISKRLKEDAADQFIVNLDARGALVGDNQARRQMVKMVEEGISERFGGRL